MAKDEQVNIEFVRPWQAYHAGDVAHFLKSTAEKLIKAGLAKEAGVEFKPTVPAQVTKVVTKS